MKLYTEEQIRKAIMIAENKKIPFTTIVTEYLTQIELPSDEDIYINANVNSENVDYNLGVIKGIQIMKELIKGGNK